MTNKSAAGETVDLTVKWPLKWLPLTALYKLTFFTLHYITREQHEAPHKLRLKWNATQTYQTQTRSPWSIKYSDKPLSFGRAMLIITQCCSSWNVDCLFSVIDLVSNGRRSSFCPRKANEISFLHKFNAFLWLVTWNSVSHYMNLVELIRTKAHDARAPESTILQ